MSNEIPKLNYVDLCVRIAKLEVKVNIIAWLAGASFTLILLEGLKVFLGV